MDTRQPELPRLAKTDEVAEILKTSVSKLAHLRLAAPESSPPFFKVGHSVLYPLDGPDGLGSWIQKQLKVASALGDDQ